MAAQYKLSVFITALIFSQCYHVAEAQSIDLIWKFHSGSSVRGGFARDAKALYFGDTDGLLYSIDTETAAVRWTFKTESAIASTPALTEKTILVTSRDNQVYCLNKIAGKLIWKFSKPITDPHRLGWDYFIASPVVNSKITYVGFGDHYLYALSTDNGKLLWTFKTNDKIRATPKLFNGKLYLPSFDGFVYVLDTIHGNLLWRFETEGASLQSENFGWDRRSINSTPSIADSLMVFGSRDGSVYCVNILTHKQKWKFTYGPTWAIVTPAIVNNTVMIGWSDNSLFCAIDLLTGKEKWKLDCGSFIYSSPTAQIGNVYFGVGNGRILCLDEHDGKLKWEHLASAPVLSTPYLADDKLYIGDDDGTVYCLGETSTPRGVYYPNKFRTSFIEKGMAIEPAIGPYFKTRGFVSLDSASLITFIANCIDRHEAGVIVLAHDYIPSNVLGKNSSESLLKKFMEAGGRIISAGQLPGVIEVDSTGNFGGVNYSFPTELLDIKLDMPLESGNYSAKATDLGRKLGLPENLCATNSMASPHGLEILAVNEIGRPAIWMKKIGTNGGGYIACRTWSYLTTVTEKDLEILWKLCR